MQTMNPRKASRRRRTAILVTCSFGALLLLAACTRIVGPKAEFAVTPTFDYPPLEVALNASASSSPNGAIVSYDWDFGDGSTGSGVTVTHTYQEKGVYAITLVVTDSTGATGARSRSVEALNRVPVAVFTHRPYYAGTYQPFTFDASDSFDLDGEIVQYIWSFGDGATGEGKSVKHQYTTPGWEPLVTLTVVDEDGGSATVSHTVLVVGCSSCGSRLQSQVEPHPLEASRHI